MTTPLDPEHMAIDVNSKMGIVEEEMCIKLIESTPIGRVGFMAGDELLVLPVNFKWHEDSIVFRTLEGQKLAAPAENQHVCFEVDEWDAARRTGWSVVVQGVAREVTNWASVGANSRRLASPWSKAEWKPIWVRIEPTMISGRVLR